MDYHKLDLEVEPYFQSDGLREIVMLHTIADESMEIAAKHFDDVTKEVINILKMFSSESCLVGGAVRDIIAGYEENDYDFVTDTGYDILTEVFEMNGFKCIETGLQFLVLNISKDGMKYEIANFRKDGTYTDGRRPDSVSIGTIDDDANRRDFSIGALYYNLKTGHVLDPTGLGLLDLSNKTLCFVGNPENRLNEDLLRVYRFYRFICKGFKPESNSLTAVRRHFKCAQKTVAPERVKDELEKMVL
jgi:tRNA nucleotidyltransferase (CCA-adding enzyme)